MKPFHYCGALILTAVLSGCSGGSSATEDGHVGIPPYAAVSPGGIYSGTLTNSFAGRTDSISGLIAENGDGFFVDATHPAIYRVKAQTSSGLSGNSFSATFRGYAGSGEQFANGASVETGSITGSIQPRSTITATYTGPNGTSGTINLAYQGAQYGTPTSLSALVGTYQYTITVGSTRGTVTFTINSSGQIAGSDTVGCSFNGNVSIPNTAFNAQQFSIAYTCSGSTVNYTGLSTYVPASGSTRASLTLEYDDANATAVAVSAIQQ